MDFTRLEKFQDWMSDDWRIPGSSMVAYVDGREVYRHSSGFSDMENGVRMNEDTLINVYSITKTVTTLAALQLLEKGLFNLNDGLDYYMPEFKNPTVRRTLSDGREEICGAKNYIRVRDLFSMTSGYEYTTDNEYIRAMREQDGSITTRNMAKALAQTPLSFEPGTRWCYGMSHDILAAFVETVSGRRFADYVKENIFEPVGMNDTYFHISEKRREKMACQYCFDDVAGVPVLRSKNNDFVFGECYDSGGAGIVSTVSDMAKYADTVSRGGVSAGGERIISARTIDLWKTNTLSDEQLCDFWDTYYGYGYGLGVRTHMYPGKSGALSPVGEFGWGGAAGGIILFDTKNRVGFFYAHHMLNNQEYFTFPRIRNVFYSCLD